MLASVLRKCLSILVLLGLFMTFPVAPAVMVDMPVASKIAMHSGSEGCQACMEQAPSKADCMQNACLALYILPEQEYLAVPVCAVVRIEGYSLPLEWRIKPPVSPA